MISPIVSLLILWWAFKMNINACRLHKAAYDKYKIQQQELHDKVKDFLDKIEKT